MAAAGGTPENKKKKIDLAVPLHDEGLRALNLVINFGQMGKIQQIM